MRKACHSSHRAAQHRGFGQLAAQGFPRLGGGERAILVQSLPQLEHQGRDLVAGGFLRSMLPIRIGAQSKERRAAPRCGPENPAARSPRPAGSAAPRVPEATSRVSSACACSIAAGAGRGLRAAHAGFDKGGRGRRQLRAPRQIKAQGMLFEPALRVVEGEDGALTSGASAPPVLPGAALLSRWFRAFAERGSARHAARSSFGASRPRSDEMPAGCLSKHTAGRWGGHAGSWWDARFWPAPPAATPCARDRAGC